MAPTSNGSVLDSLKPDQIAEIEKKADFLETPDGYAKERLGINLHPVQAAVLRDLFKQGSRISFRCGNEVGKTQTVATAAILYAIEILNAQVVSTSGSWRQITEQLIPSLKRQAWRYPGWDFNSDAICIDRINRYIGLSTTSEATFQGYHSAPGRPLLMIVDEAAAVSPSIFAAAEERCNPDYLLVMGSPLDPVGTFYDMETKSRKFYTHHKLSQMDCVTDKGWWLDPVVIKRKIEKYGAEHPLILSSVFAEFASVVANALLGLRDFENCMANPPPWGNRGDRHAFVDVAGGGDKNVFAVRDGNKVWIEKKWRDQSEMATVGEIIAMAKKLKREIGLETHEISIDAGGAGKPMADRCREVGYELNRFTGQSAPRFDEDYANAVAEAWGEGAAKIRRCEIILPSDEDFRMQVLTRTLKRQSAGKFLLESKEDMSKRGLPSPDEADAIFGCMMPAPQIRATQVMGVPRQPDTNKGNWYHREQPQEEGYGLPGTHWG